MDVSLRHQPSFAAARLTLAPGEPVRVESGAMMATSDGVNVEAKLEGGVLKSLKRAALGGESLFVTTYTAGDQGGWVDVAPNLPGDVIVAGITPDQPMNITRGSWLASSSGIELDTKWGGFRNLAGGEGGFLVHATGQGTIVLSAYGAIDTVSLQAGEKVVIDSGHAVAWSPSVQMATRKVAGKLVQTLKTGEGLVFEFTGPGWVMMQSRNPSALVEWMTSVLPGTRQ